jgi:uroporphyrinogen decarboxylase
MNSRERMMTAMRGGVPDRVPCSPDTNWMIPAKQTGQPFWTVFHDGSTPIWQAYNDCVRHFGVDGFSHHGVYDCPRREGCESSEEILSQTEDRRVVRKTFTCPAGELTQETIYLADDAPAHSKKLVDDFVEQADCLKYYMFGDVGRISFAPYNRAQADMGDSGVVGLCLLLPHLIHMWRQPSEAAFFDYYDNRALVGDFMEAWANHLVEVAQAIIDGDVEPDFIFFPNSGLVTLQSPDIVREFSLPVLKTLTGMFKRAGITTSMHCCGKERALVEMCAEETDLDCIDPLEVAPMGDCDLAEIKAKFGSRLALKGNLHTSAVMLHMSPEEIAEQARKVIEIAKPGGGFILSTGDQCGRDTPEENIRVLLDVCERYGYY